MPLLKPNERILNGVIIETITDGGSIQIIGAHDSSNKGKLPPESAVSESLKPNERMLHGVTIERMPAVGSITFGISDREPTTRQYRQDDDSDTALAAAQLPPLINPSRKLLITFASFSLLDSRSAVGEGDCNGAATSA